MGQRGGKNPTGLKKKKPTVGLVCLMGRHNHSVWVLLPPGWCSGEIQRALKLSLGLEMSMAMKIMAGQGGKLQPF